VSTPGVPTEFDAMIAEAVVAPLARHGEAIEKRSLYSFGLTEGEVDARLAPLAEKFPTVRVGFRAHMPEIHVSLSAPAHERDALEGALLFTRRELGAHVFTETKQSFAAVVLEKLCRRDATLTLAESCTGGLIGDLITDVPGSSAAFLGGFVVYANTMKEDLGVAAELLSMHGAVSEPVALAMAERARARTHATYALAVSGIAGPDGGTPDKPVGTTCIALACAETSTVKTFYWPFDRRRNKLVSAYAALDMLRRIL
jgi:nicotinamide-nucleotide amidase